MSKKHKILFCTSNTFPYIAGDGISALNFAVELKKNQVESSILTLNFNNENVSKTLYKGVKIFRVPFKNKHILDKIISRIIIIPFLIKHILQTDIVIIYGRIISYKTIILLARMLGKKVIFRSTSSNFDDIETLTKRSFYTRFVLGLISGYFATNPLFTKSFLKVFGKNLKVFESCQGVDIERFKPVDENQKIEIRKKINFPRHDRIIITTGNLFKSKGFAEIFEQLSLLNIDFLYVVVGNHKTHKNHFLYKNRHEITQLFSKGNHLLKDKIQFVNPVENIEEYLQASDLFLFNSSQEGVPNSLLEAMSCALPCVCREIPETQNYITFNEKNALSFSEISEMNIAIKRIFENQNLSKNIGVNARNFMVENYNISKVAEQFAVKFLK